MRHRSPVLFLTLSTCLFAAGLLGNSSGCGGGGTTVAPPPPPPSPFGQKIEHVVVIFQENRTPDNLFHGLPGADIANSGMNSLGQTITLQPIMLANNYDLSHAHTAFVKMYDGGKMDGADLVGVGCQAGAVGCPPPNPQFMYVNPSEVAPYFQLAQTYTFGDRMFQTNQGPVFPLISSLFPALRRRQQPAISLLQRIRRSPSEAQGSAAPRLQVSLYC